MTRPLRFLYYEIGFVLGLNNMLSLLKKSLLALSKKHKQLFLAIVFGCQIAL